MPGDQHFGRVPIEPRSIPHARQNELLLNRTANTFSAAHYLEFVWNLICSCKKFELHIYICWTRDLSSPTDISSNEQVRGQLPCP